MINLRRRQFTRRLSLLLTSALTFAALLGVGQADGASNASSAALRIGEYAVATATHDNPSHVVTWADVSNAAGIPTVNTTNLALSINLGDLFGYARLVLFVDPTSFADICLNFPDTVGATSKVVPCPHQAEAQWQSQSGALETSNRAIATAAATGRAVSGADVVAAAKIDRETLRHKPSFTAGQGGKVDFATTVEMAPNTKITVNNCVQLPKTAYGIPVLVSC
jgi:hypothetical protein